jgi:hypothetical protein
LEPNAATVLLQLDDSAEWGVCECSVKIPFLVVYKYAVSLVGLAEADANLPVAIYDFKLLRPYSFPIGVWRGTTQNDDSGHSHCSNEKAGQLAAAFLKLPHALFKCHCERLRWLRIQGLGIRNTAQRMHL